MRVMIVLSFALAACGAIGGTGGGATDLPSSGSGPFQPLAASDPQWSELNAPFVLQDSGADLDSPAVLVDGDKMTIWVAATRNHVTDIERADAARLEDGFGDLTPVLTAGDAWEHGDVASPSLIVGDGSAPWILFYGAAGAVGYATSADGNSWQKASGPVLLANGAEEGGALTSPAAVRIDDRVRVYYEASGAIWAADTAYADVVARRALTWTRLDGEVATAVRDPMLRRPPWASAVAAVRARVVTTPAGRTRHDLYFTALDATVQTMSATSTCGFAGSYVGTAFEMGGAPIVPLTQATHAPIATSYRAFELLLFASQAGARQAIAAGTSP
jgi:hypothetical protein